MPDEQAVGAEPPSNGAPDAKAQNGGNDAPDAPDDQTSGGGGGKPTTRGDRLLKWRAVVVAALGFAAVVIVVLFAISKLPSGVLDTGETDNKTPAITSIAAGAITAIVSIVSAYLGIRSSNGAREGTEMVR